MIVDNIRKAVVAHAGSRDNYELALALHENGLLTFLITDLYAPELAALHSAYFRRRHKKGLPSALVKGSIRALMSWQRTFIKDRHIGEKAQRHAEKTDSNLFLYSYYAFHAFCLAKQRQSSCHRFLFQLHPHPGYVRQVLRDELELCPSGKTSLCSEHELSYSDNLLDQLCQEPLLAQTVVAASTFTKQTLIEAGVNESNIFVVPYGIDASVFHAPQIVPNNRTLEVIFVGQMIQRKGLSYLLEALRLLNTHRVHLTLCGRGNIDTHLLNSATDLNITVKKHLSREALANQMRRSDVLVLPSLAEGFAHVITESLACGLPVITTPNSAGPDFISHGTNGYIVPIRDASAIADCLDKLLVASSEARHHMSAEASRAVENLTPQHFRKGISSVYMHRINNG